MTEDINQGWIWIRDSSISGRRLVRIDNPHCDKTVFCEAISFKDDPNFLRLYNDEYRFQIPDDDSPTIVMSAWYRTRLGDIKPDKTESTELDIVLTGDLPCAQIKAALSHPQMIVKTATVLAILSILISIVGTVIGVIF